MIIVVLFTVLGLFLMIKRIRQDIKVYTAISQRLKQKKPLYNVRGSWLSILSFVVLCSAAAIAVIINIKNPQMTGLGIMVVCIGIGELINAITINPFYYDDLGFYYYHQYIKRKEIKELKESKGLFGLTTVYSVETKNGALFSISKAGYEVLKRKGGKR